MLFPNYPCVKTTVLTCFEVILAGTGTGNYDSDSLPRIIGMLLRSLDREKLRTLHFSRFKLLTTLIEDNYFLVICDANF